MTAWSSQLLTQLTAAPVEQREEVLADVLRGRGMFENLLIETAIQGVFVAFATQLDDWEIGLGGGFTVQGGAPSITVYRPERAACADDPIAELVTLAHEVGHAVSWRLGYRTAPYLAVVDRVFKVGAVFAQAEAWLILDEELRAWRFGRSALSEKGFQKWDLFNARKAEALETYCARLGLEPNAWNEREPACLDSPKDPPPRTQCEGCDGTGWQARDDGDTRS